MKNLVVFISPQKKFFGEYEMLARILIDNSFDLNWKPEDILLVTNFSWKYNGIKSIKVGDEHFLKTQPLSIKTSIVPYLVDTGIVNENELHWNHDLDAFQLQPFKEAEIGINGLDAGLTDYGWRPRWCMGSYFFKKSANDLFCRLRDYIAQDMTDEAAMVKMTNRNARNVVNRVKRLNITYNFGMRHVEENYQRAEKPLRVVHFHPTSRRLPTWDIFVNGKNGLNQPLINDRFLAILKQHHKAD